MKILAIGDVVGSSGLNYLASNLWNFRNSNKIDFCIVNGENATEISGICRKDAISILDSGADVITLGNHTWGKRDIYGFLDESNAIIRPANYMPNLPGNGYTILRLGGTRILCINLIGNINMGTAERCPFHEADKILKKENKNFDICIVDFHAEATSEKIAMGRYLDGRVSAVFGTHTHVQTADEEILPNGTAYITDIGMTGPIHGILGVSQNIILQKFLTHMPSHFRVAEGECKAHGAIFDINENNMKAKYIQRIIF